MDETGAPCTLVAPRIVIGPKNRLPCLLSLEASRVGRGPSGLLTAWWKGYNQCVPATRCKTVDHNPKYLPRYSDLGK
jgi:hypothetical protein